MPISVTSRRIVWWGWSPICGWPRERLLNRAFSMKRSCFVVALMLIGAAPISAKPYNIYENQPEYVNQRYGGSSRDPLVRANRDIYVNNQDTNSCIEGSVIGGLLGAGLGAVLSRGNGRWVGVPMGGAAGALLGCQVDGG